MITVKVNFDFDDLYEYCNGQGCECLDMIKEQGKEDALIDYINTMYGVADIDEITDESCYDWAELCDTLGVRY